LNQPNASLLATRDASGFIGFVLSVFRTIRQIRAKNKANAVATGASGSHRR
jgi:hypothetical protein